MRRCALYFYTPSWCDGALTITPPNVADVVQEVVIIVGCLSAGVVAFFFDHVEVVSVDFRIDGVETLNQDDVKVVSASCRTVGVETLNQDDVKVVSASCRTVGVETLNQDDVVDR